MFSIDQNCHSLWDALPKLQALAGRGHRVTHFLEDVDVAFTSLGSAVGGEALRLARERFHRSGGADWGAALFYSEFLGRLPVEIRDWEPFTALKTNTLAKQLRRSVDELFDEFSPGDNWQLIGPSYVGDRSHHRVIGDLSVAETADYLRQMMEKARADMFRSFPEAGSQARLEQWFAHEQALVERLLKKHADGRLVDLYRGWMAEYLGETVRLDVTSHLFATGADPNRTALLEVFLADYELAASLYNQAVEAAEAKLRPLATKDGELPFFAVLEHQGHLVRTGVFLRDGALAIGQKSFALDGGNRIPVEALKSAGIHCLSGKAILLAIQVRLCPGGEPLALPYRGSLYMPAADRLAEGLCKHRLLPGPLHPLVRVRFRLLERLRSLKTRIRLPEHLAACFGSDEISARELGEGYAELAAEGSRRLAAFKEPGGREQWQRQRFPKLVRTIEDVESRRRALAATNPKSEEIRGLWRQAKSARIQLLDQTVRQIARDVQVRDVDIWDSRGALLPWSVALGDEGFYEDLISKAEIYEEPLPQSCRDGQEEGHPRSL